MFRKQFGFALIIRRTLIITIITLIPERHLLIS